MKITYQIYFCYNTITYLTSSSFVLPVISPLFEALMYPRGSPFSCVQHTIWEQPLPLNQRQNKCPPPVHLLVQWASCSATCKNCSV